MMKFVWVIPLLPLLSCIIMLTFGKKLKAASAYIANALMAVAFILAIFVLVSRLTNETYSYEFAWINDGVSSINLGFVVNQLNALMLVIVTLVSLLVHFYSMGYMKGDERFHIYYGYLGFFTFAMLGLVLSPNLLQLYMFWELVGLGSFLLIGFYYYKESAKKAAKKAFLMTRIGDIGLFIAILFLYSQLGTFNIDQIFEQVQMGVLSDTGITVAAILIFIGAMGKSGQFPLHTWLPDAMEGPTPVSALIHAATMVAAGVYLVATMFPLFAESETALLVVGIVGGFTAIFAASIALVQKDIKKILAYSTVSQLGYMMLALGASGYTAAIFHLTTHSVFKALLFLAAGSVIHAVNTQNIDEMGGLWKKMRFTGPLFLVGTLAITGVPFLSGFFSKDEILVSVWNADQPILFALAVITAALTAFYMFRLFFKVFLGQPAARAKRAHESPNTMVWPMMVLGVLAIFVGYINTTWFGTFLGDWLQDGNKYLHLAHESSPVWIMILAICATLIGAFTAGVMYVKPEDPFARYVTPFFGKDTGKRLKLHQQFSRVFKGSGPIHHVLSHKYYVDELYQVSIIPATKTFSTLLSLVEFIFIKGFMNGIGRVIKASSSGFARVQNGQVQTYGTFAFVGMVILLIVFVLAGGYLDWIQ